MVLALIIAFVYSWVLTLVILGVVPLVMVAGMAEVKALSGHAQKNKKAIETAGKVGRWGGREGGREGEREKKVREAGTWSENYVYDERRGRSSRREVGSSLPLIPDCS